jgi:CRISPR system Cascade subunit CasB
MSDAEIAAEQRFIRHLEGLRDDDNRAALAQLRRGLGKDVGGAVERDKWVFRCPGGVPIEIEDNCGLIASLFALWHQGSNSRLQSTAKNLGGSFRALHQGTGSESVEKRFVSLVNADRNDLKDHLRHAVSLLKAKGIPIDWGQLLRDLRKWDRAERTVQRNWSRDFWAHSEAEAVTPADQTGPILS